MARRNKSNRVKKLLKAEAKPKGIEYDTTLEDCRKWFDILNEELFDNSLSHVPFGFKWLRVCWAYYEYFPKTHERGESIIMHKRYPSQRLFVECLAHEMIHHWQYMNLGWRKVDHAEEFLDWCKKAKSIGLRIGEEQSE
jgi:hypothetical protein